MIDDMDFNCGTIVDGDKTLQEVGDEIFAYIVRVASGEKPKGRGGRLRGGRVPPLAVWHHFVAQAEPFASA